ncbi:hypothetical protein PTTG_25804 [Puccinia triticina 1-1 BBBD Race 1]|uniref:Exocyst complex component Sec10-like alpha-helical bundle domain-containing protein n=1 Tax=Puccinia triticina (isolate 1-1 / race 1 (BBBD)) TaxID=630390 RepID=A0A180H186_PUCT1|nr:hypothetical protein PTTG_25804 [Puccinia triticina 1-1 BBBD Race 1]
MPLSSASSSPLSKPTIGPRCMHSPPSAAPFPTAIRPMRPAPSFRRSSTAGRSSSAPPSIRWTTSTIFFFSLSLHCRKTEGIDGEVVEGVNFGPMERFFGGLKETVETEGATIGAIFPRKMGVFEVFMRRLIDETVAGYVGRLLAAVEALPAPLFLITSVQAYVQVRGLIGPATMAVAPTDRPQIAQKVETIIHGMFAGHLDGYLAQEVGWVKATLERLCSAWTEGMAGERGSGPSQSLQAAVSDPSMMKKTVLRAFKNALLLPVSVVPKTVSYSINALSNVGAGAFLSVTQGLILPSSPASSSLPGPQSTDYRNAKVLRLVEDGRPDDAELESWLDDSHDPSAIPGPSDESTPLHLHHLPKQQQQQQEEEDNESRRPKLRDLLSLDLVLQTISINRQALVRLQAFLPFNPPSRRQKVVDSVETIFVLLLQSLAHNHIQPAFEKAFRMMATAEHGGGGSQSLGDFFGLVEVADTVQQMVEVYADQALSGIVDQADFLSRAGTEKRLIPATSSLAALVRVAHLFAFIAPKDLARFLRDLGGAGAANLGPLSVDDLYQFVQQRADWKRIQSVVDREVYGIGVEDCVIC